MKIDYFTYEFRCCGHWYDWGDECVICGDSYGIKLEEEKDDDEDYED